MAVGVTMDMETRSFNRFIRDVVRRSDAEVSTVLRAFALKLLSRIIQRWPVDTGRSRAAWYVSMDHLGGAIITSGGGGAEEAEGRAKGQYEENLRGMDKHILMVNGVEYAVFLEMGHSAQAPYGVVRISMMELRGQLPRDLKKKIKDAWQEARRRRLASKPRLSAKQLRGFVG